jgi:hypothetical protein
VGGGRGGAGGGGGGAGGGVAGAAGQGAGGLPNATGAGGSGGVAGAGGAAAFDLAVEYRTNVTMDPTTAIAPTFQIVSNARVAVALSDLKIRYYFTADAVTTFTSAVDFAQIGNVYVTLTFVAMNPAVPGADHYMEIGFTSGAGVLASGSATGDILTRFSGATSGAEGLPSLTQANDYSFDATKTTDALWDHVTLYNAGTLAWGVPPPPSGPPVFGN